MRLYPMVLVGVVFGATVALIVHAFTASAVTAPHIVAVEALLGLTFIPVTFRIFGVAAPVVSPLDGPLWSLLCELVANGVYGLGWKFKLRNAWPVLAAISGVALVLYSAKHGTVNGGDLPTTLFDGFLRGGFGFFAGATLSRFKGIARGLRVPGWLIFGMLPAVLLVPHLGAGDAVFEDLSVFVVLPMIVLLGSRLDVPKGVEPILTSGGRISYPLYLIHSPLLHLLVLFQAACRSRISARSYWPWP